MPNYHLRFMCPPQQNKNENKRKSINSRISISSSNACYLNKLKSNHNPFLLGHKNSKKKNVSKNSNHKSYSIHVSHKLELLKNIKEKKIPLQSIDSTNWQMKETKKSSNPETRIVNFIFNLPWRSYTAIFLTHWIN